MNEIRRRTKRSVRDTGSKKKGKVNRRVVWYASPAGGALIVFVWLRAKGTLAEQIGFSDGALAVILCASLLTVGLIWELFARRRGEE